MFPSSSDPSLCFSCGLETKFLGADSLLTLPQRPQQTSLASPTMVTVFLRVLQVTVSSSSVFSRPCYLVAFHWYVQNLVSVTPNQQTKVSSTKFVP